MEKGGEAIALLVRLSLKNYIQKYNFNSFFPTLDHVFEKLEGRIFCTCLRVNIGLLVVKPYPKKLFIHVV